MSSPGNQWYSQDNNGFHSVQWRIEKLGPYHLNLLQWHKSPFAVFGLFGLVVHCFSGCKILALQTVSNVKQFTRAIKGGQNYPTTTSRQ